MHAAILCFHAPRPRGGPKGRRDSDGIAGAGSRLGKGDARLGLDHGPEIGESKVMRDFVAMLSDLLAAAFVRLGLDPKWARAQPADRSDLADFQCNGAMPAAKSIGEATRALAERIASELAGVPELSDVACAGPGFINLRVSDAALTRRAEEIAGDPRAGAGQVAAPRRIIIDYGGPNVAKPMHVGHLRATIIGDSAKRLFRFRGDEVWGDAHFGDWGFQMGLLIAALSEEQPDLPFFDPEFRGQYPAESPVTLEDLERLYPLAVARAKADPESRDKARRATAELQGGHPGYRALWAHMAAVSRTAQKREFAALGVEFDFWYGESDADPFIADMIDDLDRKGLLVEDQGARIIRVNNPEDKRELPPLLVVSSEGSAMYGTTDLATIVQRSRRLDPDLVLYFVDARQSDHFEQVFRASALAGYLRRDQLEHIGFGTMNGPDGKPFKTRAGGVMKLHDLISEAVNKAETRLDDAGIGDGFSPGERADIARKVAIAAIKFADLQSVRTTNYVFDLDQFMSFEGRTGPYLLYAAVRIRSILRKLRDSGHEPGPIRVADPRERALVLRLDAFDSALRAAYDKRMPHFLCEHAFTLAQAFSTFYANCPILEAPPDQRASRARLAEVTFRQLLLTLDLLGIEAPERM